MPGPTTISVPQLARLIGTPDCPALVDICLPEDFAADPRLIPGAIRQPFAEIAALAPALAGKRVVVICQKGLKLSEGAAAILRSHGVPAENLEGGAIAWAAAGLPMVPIAAVPASTLWVTRHRPRIDRIACPWLIRRFVQPAARFLYVSPAEVPGVAQRFDATPFDIEGGHFSHRAERCTFDTMVAEFGLSSEAMERLATVIRAADTDRHDLAPQAAGLLAISVGLSRQYRDDLAQLEAGMAIYDALYRWARDGHDERHDWPTGRA